jgi:hypothetical protein
MCLYPTLIKNKKYTSNKKNGGQVPMVQDPRTLYVAVGCQNCIECRKQKARAWQVRLLEDIKQHTNGIFTTLTFNNEAYKELSEAVHEKYKIIEGYELDNEIATLAVRRFLERHRKEHKKSLRHWLVTELGHNGTENIHMHGIIWTNDRKQIEKHWQYGYIWTGKYLNAQTVNYTIKYIHKMDFQHQYYKSIILTSPGIGSNYEGKQNKYNNENTNEQYRTSTGHKLALPIYYRNKIYTDQEKEKLWIQKLDKDTRYILGTPAKTYEEYFNILDSAQQLNKQLGYGTHEKNWQRAEYEKQRRIIIQNTRMQKANNKAPSAGPAVGPAGPSGKSKDMDS